MGSFEFLYDRFMLSHASCCFRLLAGGIGPNPQDLPLNQIKVALVSFLFFHNMSYESYDDGVVEYNYLRAPFVFIDPHFKRLESRNRH